MIEFIQTGKFCYKKKMHAVTRLKKKAKRYTSAMWTP